MMLNVLTAGLARSALMFVVIMDPFASAAYLTAVSARFTGAEKRAAVNSATAIAGSALLAFLALGPVLLTLLKVSVASFQVAGGIVLLVISVNYLLGTVSGAGQAPQGKSAAVMIIGVPLITGPGVLTATILMVGAHGHVHTGLAALLALAAVWLMLRLSHRVHALLGQTGLEIASRVMGLLLAVLAVEYVGDGIGAWWIEHIGTEIRT